MREKVDFQKDGIEFEYDSEMGEYYYEGVRCTKEPLGKTQEDRRLFLHNGKFIYLEYLEIKRRYGVNKFVTVNYKGVMASGYWALPDGRVISKKDFCIKNNMLLDDGRQARTTSEYVVNWNFPVSGEFWFNPRYNGKLFRGVEVCYSEETRKIRCRNAENRSEYKAVLHPDGHYYFGTNTKLDGVNLTVPILLRENVDSGKDWVKLVYTGNVTVDNLETKISSEGKIRIRRFNDKVEYSLREDGGIPRFVVDNRTYLPGTIKRFNFLSEIEQEEEKNWIGAKYRGYATDYEINVLSHNIRRKGDRGQAAFATCSDYICVCANPNSLLLHVLIASTFKSETFFKGTYCNHIDGNKTNNSLDNLEFISASENMFHAHNVVALSKPHWTVYKKNREERKSVTDIINMYR